MKKIVSVIIISLLFSATACAQGVSKLFGLVGGNVQANQSSNGFLFSTDSSGNNLQQQYNFPVNTFGANPQNLEMIPYNGKLYGTTSSGGANNFGTIFEYDPFTNNYIKKFDFGPNVSVTGGSPKGSLLLYNNKFYGLGADYGVSGGGVIFEWDPATNIYTKKYDLGGSGGANPQNSLRLMNGKMYGTTASGGTSNVGVVFEWDPATNAYTKLLDLNGSGAGSNGWTFYNNITPYNNKLYCITQQGGVNNYGVILMIDPLLPYGSNTTIVKQLDATSGGAANNNEMIVYNNKLYGCLNGGGSNGQGTLFELNPLGNVFTKLVDFNSTATGGSPLGKLVPKGVKFLGLCSVGGVNNTGTIYEWDPANPATIVKKYDFGVNNYDRPVNPGSTLALFNSKFYAVTYNSGFVNQGTLFEFDYTANTVTKKLTFNAAENGRIPFGRPTLLDGKIYGTCYQGPQEIFGTPYGCLWEFDPSTAAYSRRFLFDNPNNGANGRAPASAPIAYNGKLYGTTTNGGTSDLGLLYEYDPATSGYSKKDMQPIGGSFPIGEPTAYNNKLYGMTTANGAGNNGIIYSYDPATGTLVKLLDAQSSGTLVPNGGFTVYNNKLYGTTSGGGANNIGGVIVYDPANNTAITTAIFTGSIGFNIANKPTLHNNKFYMTALSGGPNGRGAILQFDPATNIISNVYNFSTTPGGTGYDPRGELTVSGNKLYCITSEGNNIVKVVEFDPSNNAVTAKSTYTTTNQNIPVTHNGLTVVPAFIANGTAGSCETYPTVAINASNTNQWVPVLNTAGDVVAEIRANGNLLGNVTAATYINNGTVREDAFKQLYMDRNITITTQNPVTGSNVDIRLYIKTSEYLALKNATNTMGQPSGIATINDVAIFKNEEGCSGTITLNATRLTTIPGLYEYGYVLSASINSFSTFYFAKNTLAVLPISLISFDAVKQNSNVKIDWVTENEINAAKFEVERSSNNGGFTAIGTVAAKGNTAQTNYTINDNQPFAGVNYYRLRSIDKGGQFTYSNIVKVDFGKIYSINILPNPAHDYITVTGASAFKQIQVIDVAGKMVKQMNKQVNNHYSLSGLGAGIYFIRLVGDEEITAIKIVIE